MDAAEPIPCLPRSLMGGRGGDCERRVPPSSEVRTRSSASTLVRFVHFRAPLARRQAELLCRIRRWLAPAPKL